jgi:hypothetical protein
MARGNDAKQQVIQKISQAFGSDWIGEVDKKYYVWANENGEKLQIAITLTCPKTMVEAAPSKPVSFSNKMDFEAEDTFISPAPATEITEEEKQNLQELMARLGL